MNVTKAITIFSIFLLLVSLALCLREISALKSELNSAVETSRKAKEQTIQIKKEYDENVRMMIKQKEEEYESLFDFVNNRLDNLYRMSEAKESKSAGDVITKGTSKNAIDRNDLSKENRDFIESILQNDLQDLYTLQEIEKEKLRKAVRAAIKEYDVEQLYKGLLNYAQATYNRLKNELSLNESQANSLWIILERQSQDFLQFQLNLKDQQQELNKKLTERRRLTATQIKLILNDTQRESFDKIARREGWN